MAVASLGMISYTYFYFADLLYLSNNTIVQMVKFDGCKLAFLKIDGCIAPLYNGTTEWSEFCLVKTFE